MRTHEEITAQILAALEAAPKTTSRQVLKALREAGQFIEDLGLPTAPPGFLTLARQCANVLDEAAALKIGVMDSDSKVAAVNAQRMEAMQSVAARLRDLS